MGVIAAAISSRNTPEKAITGINYTDNTPEDRTIADSPVRNERSQGHNKKTSAREESQTDARQ